MQKVWTGIDLNEIEQVELSHSTTFNISLIKGPDLSDEALLHCKKQLEWQGESNFVIRFDSERDSLGLKGDRSLEILIEAPVKFEPKFLELVAKVFVNSDTALLYSDFEIDFNGTIEDIKLPAWSPIRFESIDYLGPVVVFDADFLRLSNQERTSREQVIKNAHQTSKRISRLPRSGYTCDGWTAKPRHSMANYDLPKKVSVIIPTRGISDERGSLLERCVDSLSKQQIDSDVEIIVVLDAKYEAEVVNRTSKNIPVDWSFEAVEFSENFNFSKKCNIGATKSIGDVLIFLNDDVEVISKDAIAMLASSALRKNVGASGSILKFHDGSIQHAGITLQDVKPRNAYLDQFPEATRMGDLEVTHEVSAATGACLSISRTNFDESGGWNEDLPNSYNDVDLCLRLNEMGLQTIVRTDLEVLHHESVSRDASFDEMSFSKLKSLWPDHLGSEIYLRSPKVLGIEYEGIWGACKKLRVDLTGQPFRYAIHLMREFGFTVMIKSAKNRLNGSTESLLRIQEKAYL